MMDNYRFIGPIYDGLCHLYAGNAISKCRTLRLDNVDKNTNILFAGVGPGKDAIFAAKLGAKVTVVDISKTMLDTFKNNCHKEGVSKNITVIESDILSYTNEHGFDIVVANFFLNVFDLPTMKNVLQHLLKQARPNAKLIISDFSHPSHNNIFTNIFIKVYWYLANVIFWITTKNPVHAIYNYPKHLSEFGINDQHINYIKFLRCKCFWSIEATIV